MCSLVFNMWSILKTLWGSKVTCNNIHYPMFESKEWGPTNYLLNYWVLSRVLVRHVVCVDGREYGFSNFQGGTNLALAW